jgi:hypothetical protein
VQAPLPEGPEAAQVLAGGSESLKETRQHRLAGHPPDPEQIGHERVAAEMGTAVLPMDRPSADKLHCVVKRTHLFA